MFKIPWEVIWYGRKDFGAIVILYHPSSYEARLLFHDMVQ